MSIDAGRNRLLYQMALGMFPRSSETAYRRTPTKEDSLWNDTKTPVSGKTYLELDTLLEGLSNRERFVVRLRCGIDRERSESLTEIGRTLGVTKEGVRHIEAKALRRLRSWVWDCLRVLAVMRHLCGSQEDA